MNEDNEEDTPPLLMMGDLIRYFESQSRLLDKRDHMITGRSQSDYFNNEFVSNIKFSGIPILPPVMTTKRRDEMMAYRRQAQFREKRLRSRQRSRLMARAQNIVEDSQTTDLSDLDTLSSNFSHPDGSSPQDVQYQFSKVTRSNQMGQLDPTRSNQFGSTSQEQTPTHTPLQTLTNAANTFATMDHNHYGSDDPGLQTLDSLSSDLASMEDTSLPTNFSGIPLTSVRQQQISQNLARLSKALNMSQSLNSTGSSEVSEAGQIALKLSLGSPQPSAARFYNPANYSHSESSSVFHESQDTIVEVSQDLTANSTSGFVSNANSELQTDGSSHSPNDSVVNTSQSSANCSSSTVDSQKSNKSSPKSLKNTVHFANFVTEITRQSVEDDIKIRKLEDTPTNSPRVLSPDVKPLFSQAQSNAVKSKNASTINAKAPESMLSRVEFSHDGDSTPSPIDPSPRVPFQGYSHDNEHSTSDKENEQRPVSRRGPASQSTESASTVRSSDRVESSQTSVSTSHSIQSTDSYLSVQSSEVPGQSVDESQTSVRSFQTVGTSDSESSTLRTDTVMSSRNSSCFSGPLPANSTSTDIQQFIRNIIGGPAPEVKDVSQSGSPTPSAENKDENTEQTDQKKGHKKGHVRRGSYTLSEPSPVLLRSHGLTSKDQETAANQVTNPSTNQTSIPPAKHVGSPSAKQVMNLPLGEEMESRKIPRKLNYEEVEDQIKPINIPMPPGPEADAKVDQINRYLSQQEKLTHSASPSTNSDLQNSSIMEGSVMDSMSIVQSLMESIESLPDADPESVLKIHAGKIELLRQQMVDQQRRELEELFVQQRREQLLLQQEVEAHQQRLREQQEFLSANAPENIKKARTLSRSMGDLEHTETKVKNVPYHNSNPAVDRQGVSPAGDRQGMSPAGDRQGLMRQSTPRLRGAQSPKVYRPVLRSPMKSAPPLRRNGPVFVPNEAYDPAMKAKFDRVTAVAKGFLTRRLLQSEKVQELLLTIKDTRDFALSFSSETPIKRGNFSNQDRDLLERIIAQLQAALLDIHEIFFEIPVQERMSLIAHTRQLHEEKRIKSSGGSLRGSHPRISSATLKAMERKRMAQQAEASVFGGASTSRPRTAPPATSSPRAYSTDLRALRPLQGQISPIRAEGTSPRNEKERPKTAPERSDSLKTRRQSAPAKTGNTTTTNHTAKQSRPQSSSKSRVTAKKPDKKTEKAWR